MRFFLLCLYFSACSTWAHAEIVKIEIRPKISASAAYLAGDAGKPVILLLHGFLQTREFSTVVSLAQGLQSAGYPVLSPTLSLGIPGRRQSLACEAVHRHGMDDDVEEISRWVDWLKAHGHRSIVLVGHSFGSLQLLAYLNAHRDPSIKGFIAASLVEAQIGTTSRPRLIAELEKHLNDKPPKLITATLSFCKNYTAPRDKLLSYVRWGQSETLGALKDAPVVARLIMGDADSMVGNGWIKAMKHLQMPLIIIPGGNHFMDGAHEFDLLESTLGLLQQFDKAASR